MTNKKAIIGLTGKIAGGKGTVAKYLKEKYGASTYRFSTMLRDVLERMYLDITRENMQKISTVLRQNFSEDIMAKVMAEDVKKDESQVIIVDGVRRLADIKYLRELEGFKLVAIEANPRIRYERLVKRAENKGDADKSYEQFLKEESGEAEAQIPEVMAAADTVIDNNGSFEDLEKQVAEVLEEIEE